MKRTSKAGDGNFMAALACMHADIDVAPLFQITPTTQFAEWLTEFKSQGLMPHAQILLMNGEDDAYTAAHTASQCGVRVGTGSCSQGIAFALQPILSAAGSRCAWVNFTGMRGLSAPITIHATHEIMILRDAGIIILIAKNPQEVYDLMCCAFKIAEDPRIQLPVIVGCDGFDVSHTVVENSVLNEEGILDLRAWLGRYNRPNSLLDKDHPVSLGGLVLPQHHMDVVYSQLMAMENVIGVMEEVFAEYRERFGEIPELINEYNMNDAEYSVVSLGSSFGQVKEAVDIARESGIKVGALSVLSYRPFPVEHIRKALANMKAAALLDRYPTFGSLDGPLGADIAGVFKNSSVRPALMSCIYGIGGRTLSVEHTIDQVIKPLVLQKETWLNNTRPVWIGVNGGK